MNAMAALALLDTRTNKVVSKPNLKKTKKLKLVNLTQKAKVALSAEKQEDLVLGHRVKARSLAHSILRRWRARLDTQEVDSVVDLSLCEAVRRYDPKKGASFITFLFYHLRGNLIRAVSTAASSNYVPFPDHEALDSALEHSYGSRRRLVNAIEIAETLCNHDYESPDDALLKKEIAQLSTDACAKLDPLEREVIYRIYVLEQQLMDIAESLGYSRCHISRVKRKALETLHKDLRGTVKPEGSSELPNFGAEGEEDTRKIRRRKPRADRAKLRRQSDERVAA